MRFSIITPSFRSSQWLPLCINSVADQGLEVEHIVQDAGSDDGTLDWLPLESRVQAFIENDAGMYDAVNRGLRRSRGEILAYLNCDEQYLPGALRVVSDYFREHPDVDVVFADALVLDDSGNFVCYRKVVLPMEYHVRVSHLPTFTATTFFHRRLIERGFFFDEQFRCSGDAEWVCRLIRSGVRMAVLRRFTSIFTDTGSNLALSDQATFEDQQRRQSAPAWVRKLAPAIVVHHRLRRLLAGAYCQGPLDYAVYTAGSPKQRVHRHVARPTALWQSRLQFTARRSAT